MRKRETREGGEEGRTERMKKGSKAGIKQEIKRERKRVYMYEKGRDNREERESRNK